MSDEQKHQHKQEVMKVYSVIYALLVILFGVVFFNAVRIATWGGGPYRELAQKASNDSLIVEANRGNIYDCNGKLIASTIPYYRMHMDMRADGLCRDTFNKYIDSLSICLSRLYGTASPYEFKQRLRGAYNAGKRYFLVDGKRLNYTQYKRANRFPLLRKGARSGVNWDDETIHREHPFGKLAARTIGNNYAEGTGYTGLEKAFNTELSGRPGIAVKEKRAGRKIRINVVDPVDGLDVVSTLDIDMQDIAEDALEKRLIQSDAEWGCAVLMEVKTGEIKAIANLSRRSDSTYYEIQNHALSALTEPGSTFKTASVMIALDDGLADTSEVFDTGFGYWKEDDWTMTDHNVEYNRDGTFAETGGYHNISLEKSMWYSSNIGIAKMIDKYYRNKPQKFVNHIYDMRLKEPLDIIIPGAAKPKFIDPSEPGWNRASLLWMSFGYNMQIPPIYTLAFYNGIANDGKMITPVFAKSINESGTVLKKFGTSTVKSRLCSEKTLKKVRKMLEGVVTNGTGKAFKSDVVSFAGKTGTAQTNYWDKKAVKKHQYSFCGYFPAENPKYSCIVVIFQPNRRMTSPAGLTFRDIAEHISAREVITMEKRQNNKKIKLPHSLKGNRESLETVFDHLDIPYRMHGTKENRWANTTSGEEANHVSISSYGISRNTVPNVVGMGAKDAVYLMERNGMRVRLHGYGDVISQSVGAGTSVMKGAVVDLMLRHN